MAESAVTFLLNKIAPILQDEMNLLRGCRKEVEWIKDELERMKAFLRVADSMEDDDDEEIKVWVKQVRYAAYDTDDVLDEFQLRIEHPQGARFLPALPKVGRSRHGLASKIQSIKSRIMHISEGYSRYCFRLEVAGSAASSSSSAGNNDWLDCRGDGLLMEESELVGITEPKRQLVEWLLEGDSRMNVVSVVGMGGLGKTTLIKKVYDQVKNHFKSHAWINVSQSFKLEELLRDIIRQLFNEMIQPVPERVETMNRDDLKATINEFLKERKYVIVLDDVWRINDWKGFRYALPNNNLGSRVILTTRHKEVASRSSTDCHGSRSPYILNSLSSEESLALFCKKTFQTDSCPPHLIEMSENILKRCDGLPLAIVTISNVLSTKDSSKIDEWEMIYRSLGVELKSSEEFKSTRKILSLGFNDLPHYLKSCFLYLSIFPEDYLIDRMRLIRLWMAEGFIEEKQGKTQEEVADEYLNELLSRSMIQVAGVTEDGRVKTCRVHDLIREIILSKSKDEIFVAANEPNPRWPERIRCISIHNINNISNLQQIKSSASRLRSLHMFGLVNSSLSSFSMASFSGINLKLLSVLDLTGAPLEIFSKNIIVQLINLRYLSLRDTKVKNLSNSIGKLQNLETLDLKRSCITELPVNILKLKRLRHLLLYRYGKPPVCLFPSIYGFKAPSEYIGGLLSLQKLSHIEANPYSGTSSLVKEIGNLTQLRRLGITKLRKEDGETLCSSMGKLRNLRSLSLQSIQEDEIIDLHYLGSPPPYLRLLELRGCLEKLPQWIPSAHSLVRVILKWSRLKEDPLESLGDLPNLVSLHLFAAYDGHTLRFKSEGFQRLKLLSLYNLQELRTVRVEVGAMPKLEKLYIFRCKLLESVPSGIASLSNLNIFGLWDMSHKLIKMINPNQEEEGGDYSTIAHISRVQIFNGEDGHFEGYNRNIEYYS